MNRIVVLGALLLPTGALANNFSYNYIEARTAINPEMSGTEFVTQFTGNSHLVFRGDSQFDKDYDVATGVGFNGPIGQFADIYGQLLVHNTKYTEKDGAERETEIEFNLGLRAWIMDQIELTGRVGRFDDASIFHAGIRFHSTEQLSLSAETRNNGIYGPQIHMSVRFQF